MFDRSIGLLLLAIFVSNTIYGLASPFLPTVLEEKEIAPTWTGIIFAAFAVASTAASLLTGKILDKISHNKVIMFGCILMSASITAFGMIEQIVQDQYVISISIFLRLC